MSRIITKIEFKGKIIGSKPLSLEENLTTVRNKIKEKTKNINYQFLDLEENTVEIQDEDDYKLSDIIKDKKIKIIAFENGLLIKIFLNDKEICSKSISELQYINEVRNLLKNEINQDFNFLDADGCDIEKEDEKDYSVKDILNNQSIYLKCNKQIEPEPKTTPQKQSQNKIDSKTDDNNLEPPPKASKIKFDLSKYKEVKNKELEAGIKLYSYSEKGSEKPPKNERVFEYFYDDFDLNDYKDAYIVLFCGKTGDGKSTAINAFFNIIKGVRLDDNFRFVLINEDEKEGGQSVSQTDGVHLYYLKDYSNKPIIIIDSQGYGDTRGPTEDAKITKAFFYVFTDIIDHINAACFISKAINNRLDTLTKYIFSSVTSLFAENISENFVILATFANGETMKKGPKFIESINQDASFLNINKRMDKNYWFAFDSKALFEDDINSKLTKYSYDQLCKLYEEKIKKLFPKSTKESGQIVSNREQLKVEINNLNTTFKDLTVEQTNLKEKERVLNEVNIKLKEMECQIRALQEKRNTITKNDQKAYEEEIRKFNDSFNKKLSELSKKKRKEKKKILEADSKNQYTYCNQCKENCHNPCDCWFSFASRCKIFPIFGNDCERCGHNKKVHKQEYYHYIYIEEEVSENTADEEKSLTEENEKEKEKYRRRIEELNNEKDSLQKNLYQLQYNKEDLLEERRQKEDERKKVQEEVDNINRKMKIIIMKLQRLSEEIFKKGMNKNHTKTESEYIDSLSAQMHEMGYKEDEIKKQLGDIKENNKLLESMINIPQEELLLRDANELMDTYGEQKKNK